MAIPALLSFSTYIDDTHARLYSVATIRATERLAFSCGDSFGLMQRAGAAIADWLAARLLGNTNILLLAGPGNNGGDALVAAVSLRQRGIAVQVWMAGNPAFLQGDALHAWQQAQAADLTVSLLHENQPLPALPERLEWIVDGLFGIGLQRPLQGVFARLVETVNAWSDAPIVQAGREPRRVLAIDVPSGLDAGSGQAAGESSSENSIVLRATHTLTFIGNKIGLHTGIGRDVAGEIIVDSLQVEALLGAAMPEPEAWLSGSLQAPICLPRRHHASHKGTHGNVAVLGGAAGMVGAPLLGARAALKCGAGRVFCGFVAANFPALDAGQPELMLGAASDLEIARMHSVVVGPGLGRSSAAQHLLAAALSTDTALVVDADALNLVAATPTLQQTLRQRSERASTVLTPHPLEAARLLDCEVRDIQQDRLAAAQALQQTFSCVVVLKGSGTVIAAPAKPAAVNPTGNGALATAGTGDVLAGLISGLLAQGLEARQAAIAAVWLHGAAADRLVAQGLGPVGLSAGELIDTSRWLINHCTAAGAVQAT